MKLKRNFDLNIVTLLGGQNIFSVLFPDKFETDVMWILINISSNFHPTEYFELLVNDKSFLYFSSPL